MTSLPEGVRVFQEGIPTYYVNSVNLLVGTYDLTLTLRQVQDVTDEGVVSYSTLARVVMSPQHAKVLADLLSDRVAQYERTFGSLHTREQIDALVAESPEGFTDHPEAGEATAEDDSPSEPEPPA